MSEPIDAAAAAVVAALGELVRREVALQVAAVPKGLDAAEVDARIAAAIGQFADSIRTGLLVDGPAKPPDPPAA